MKIVTTKIRSEKREEKNTDPSMTQGRQVLDCGSSCWRTFHPEWTNRATIHIDHVLHDFWRRSPRIHVTQAHVDHLCWLWDCRGPAWSFSTGSDTFWKDLEVGIAWRTKWEIKQHNSNSPSSPWKVPPLTPSPHAIIYSCTIPSTRVRWLDNAIIHSLMN